MPGCHESEADARGAFIVTPYAVGADGVLVASMPTTCPRHQASEEPCCLRVDHHRERKTGPCFALAVVRCGLHGKAFTLYPPGHVPYGRVAVAPVSPDGALVKGEPPRQYAPVAPPDWPSTVFGAAVDAAAGRAWPRKHPAHPAHWRTQGRRLVRGARLIGISPRTAADELRHREGMARRLGVPTLVLVGQARRWSEARGYRERGSAIAGVLAEMEASRTISDRLMCAGEIEGLWGVPSRWDPGGRVLRRQPFS